MEMIRVSTIVKEETKQGNGLITILEKIQEEFNYLPEEALKTLANETRHSLMDIYSIATFYKSFSLEPRGKYVLTVCAGTACHVRGAPRILDTVEKNIKIKSGQTSKDMQFTLEKVNCLGACALGPIVVMNNEYHGKMNIRKTRTLINNLTKNEEDKTIDKDKLEYQ